MMSIIRKYPIAILSLLTLLIGCAPRQYVAGDSFHTDIYVDQTNKYSDKTFPPTYKREGIYKGNDVYSVMPFWKEQRGHAGLLAKKTADPSISTVVAPLNQEELDIILAQFAKEQRQIEAKQRAVELKKQKEGEEQSKRNVRERELMLENQRLAKEQCLGSGPIGVCQKSRQNQSVYVCNPNLLYTDYSFALKYCYATDNYSITSYLEVRNNLDRPARDITFTCRQIANSGTVLATDIHTVYDIWKPNQVRNVSIKVAKHSQVNYMECKASSWK